MENCKLLSLLITGILFFSVSVSQVNAGHVLQFNLTSIIHGTSDSDREYTGGTFTTNNVAYTATIVTMNWKPKVGSPVGNVTLSFWNTDQSGTPTTLLSYCTGSLSMPAIAAAGQRWWNYTGCSQPLAANTQYAYINVNHTADDENENEIQGNGFGLYGGGGLAYGADGSSWISTNPAQDPGLYVYSDGADTTPPTITLTSPSNDSTVYYKDNPIAFKAIATDASGIAWCALYHNNSGTFELIENKTGISSGVEFNYSYSGYRGKLIWNVQCADNSANKNLAWASFNYTLTVANSAPTLDNLWPNDDYHDRVNLTVNFTYNDADNDTGTCELYINGSLNASQSSISNGSIVEFSINTSTDGAWNWYVYCTDSTDFINSSVRIFVLDTINPIIYWTYPLNTTISNKDLSLNVRCSDENLYMLWINVTNSAGAEVYSKDYETNLTDIIANDTIPFTYQDNYTVNITCSDEHTAGEIKNYDVTTDLGNDKLIYDTGNNQISISLKTSGIDLDDFSTVKQKDRYVFSYDFSSVVEDGTLRTYTFVLEALHPLVYLPNSGYKAHFVSYRNWIDFNLDDDSAEYTVVKVNDNKYEITIKTTKTLLEFASIGGLNIVSEKALYQFEITPPYYTVSGTNGSSSTKTGETVYFNITWLDANPSHYTFCFGDGVDCVNETAQTYISGQSIVIPKQITAVHNQQVQWQFFANDTAGNGNKTSLGTFTIANTIPTTPTKLVYDPTTAYSDSLLNCSASGSTDADSESITYYYEFRDSDDITVLQAFSSTSTFNCNVSGCNKNDVIYCHAYANDGYANSTELSTNITILNKAPTHSTPILNSSLNTNYTNENLTCNAVNVYDADNDSVVNLYAWYKDGSAFNDLYLPFETNFNDYSGSGNAVTNYGAVLANGTIGNASEFNGTTYIRVADKDSLDFSTTKSWEIWFKRTTTGEETLFDKKDGGGANYKLKLDSNNKLEFSYGVVGVDGGEFTWYTNREANFSNGTFTYTYFNTTNNAVQLSPANTSGTYTSKVFDATATSSWKNLSWTEALPYGEELPDNKGIDKGANMTGNILLMHMNEATGPIIDYSGSGNNGTYNGALYSQAGKFNNAIGFDGTNDYVEILDDDSLSFTQTGSQMTISLWMYSEDTSGTPVLVSKYNSNVPRKEYLLYLDATNTEINMILSDDGSANSWMTSTDNFVYSTNQWQHIVWTVDIGTNTQKIYVNGVEKIVWDDFGTGITDMTNTAESVKIGANINTAGTIVNHFDGIIDEVAIYNITLSAEEILNHYKRGALNLNLTVRSCDDANCSGEAWNETFTEPDLNTLNVENNTYFQYKATFSTTDTKYSPLLYNVTVDYIVQQVTPQTVSLTSNTGITDTTNWHYAAVTFDKDVAVDNFNIYINGNLDKTTTQTNTPNNINNNLFIGKNYENTSYFNGKIDEFRIYDRALTQEQIKNNFALKYNILSSTETARNDVWICNITLNDGEEDSDTKSSNSLVVKNYPPDPVDLLFPKNDTVMGALSDFNWTSSYDLDGDTINCTLQISTNKNFAYINYTSTSTNLNDTSVILTSNEIKRYYWRVRATDNIDNSAWTDVRQFNYSQWNVTFNVTSGEFDVGDLNNVTIYGCTYSGFNQGGDTDNFYGPYGFPNGTWQCSFFRQGNYNKTQSFIVDQDKFVQVVLSERQSLTDQEHTWLEALYNCIILKDCDLYDLLVQINTTVTNVWEHTRPTDSSVVTSEVNLSTTVNSTHNISYQYIINIPHKAGYATNTYLPIRIGYWFINKDTGQCYSQGSYPDGIELVEPYCQPLMTERIGPMGGTINFRVDLRPGNLTVGTYNITRSVEIDPNNVWNNYGQEFVGQIAVTENLFDNKEGISSTTLSINEVKTTEVIVQSSGGGGGGGGITNIYNTYITEPKPEPKKEEKKEGEESRGKESGEEKKTTEEEQTQESKEAKESGLAGITGFAVKEIPKPSSLVGSMITIIIVSGGLTIYIFTSKKFKYRVTKKKIKF